MSAISQASNASLEQLTLLPLADANELYVQSFLLSLVQKAILEGAVNTPISLDLSGIEKNVCRRPVKNRFVLSKVLYSSGAMRLLDRRGDTYSCIPLFTDMVFQKATAQKATDHLVDLTPNWQYWDAFFGYVFGYQDLYRSVLRRPTLGSVIGETGPLCVWRSIWLDLSGVELGVFLRMEKSMQWLESYVHWQGIYAMPLARVFDSFSFANQKLFQDHLARQIQCLDRLCNKLYDHGFLSPSLPREYMVFDPQDEQPAFLWQASKARFLADDAKLLRNELCAFFFTKIVDECKSQLKSILCAGSHGLAQFDQLLDTLRNVATDPLVAEQSLVIDGNTIVSLLLLFIEWRLRAEPGHPYPLPKAVLHSEIGREFLMKHQTADKSLYLSFAYKMSSSPVYRDLLEKETMAVLCSQKSMSIIFAQPQTQSQVAVKEPVIPASPPVAKPVEKTSVRETEPFKLMPRPDQKRKNAQAELERIRDLDQPAYSKLTKIYIESLDIPSRKLILDIKQKMQPKIFDHHIKQRLVQFMIDNPVKWQDIGQDVMH